MIDFSFLKLKFLSRRKKKPEEAQAEAMETVDSLRRLVRDADWLVYKRFLDAHISANVQALLAGGTDAEVHRLRGLVSGLLQAVQLAENQVQQDDSTKLRQQRDATAGSRRAESERSALYSSGHWGN